MCSLRDPTPEWALASSFSTVPSGRGHLEGLPTVFRSLPQVFRRTSDVFRLTSEVFPRSSLLSTVSTWANDAVLQTIKLCSVDQLSSYRCELDEIQDKNKLSRAPFILFGVGVVTRQVFRGSSDGLPIASGGLPMDFRWTSEVYGGV